MPNGYFNGQVRTPLGKGGKGAATGTPGGTGGSMAFKEKPGFKTGAPGKKQKDRSAGGPRIKANPSEDGL